MVASNWVNLEGEVVGQKYRLTHLIEPGSQEARFEGEAIDAGPGRFVISVTTRHGGGPVRPEELRHPHLRRVFASGVDTVQGLEIHYVVLENVGESLAGILRHGPLDERAAGELALDAVSALDHLHGRGYVYAGLRPSAVARSERGWVLSDFDLLRRKGSVDPAETRLMLAASPHVPPDAYSGLVSPAWDLWSLGVVLNQALTGAPERSGRRSKPSPAPPPFDSIIRGCLDPDPNERIGLRDVAGLLGADLHRSLERPREPQPKSERPAQVETTPPTPPRRINGLAQTEAGLAQTEAPVSRTKPGPALPVAGRSGQRRRSRLYSTPVVEAPPAGERLPALERLSALERLMDKSIPAPEEVHSPWERLGPRARKWAVIGLGLLAVAVGVLLAVLNTREQSGNTGAQAGELRTPAQREEVKTPVAPENPSPQPPPPPVDPQARKAAVIPFVIEWARSMRELDLEKHVTSYAPVVDVFLTKRGVPLSEIRAEKEKLFSGISEVRRFGVRTIRIESFQPERAVVSFRKDWDLRGRTGTSGAERERFTLKWIDGRWRISVEQQVTIYRKSRPSRGD